MFDFKNSLLTLSTTAFALPRKRVGGHGFHHFFQTIGCDEVMSLHARALLARAAAFQGPFVLAGDFNVQPGTKVRALWMPPADTIHWAPFTANLANCLPGA